MSWVPSPGARELSDLSDVDTSGVSDDQVLRYDADTGMWLPGDAGSGGGGGQQVLPFHRAGELEVVSGTLPFPAPFAMSILGVRAAVGTPPDGDDILIDVNVNGSTIFTTQGNRPTVSDGNTTSAEATPDVTSVNEGDLLTVDIDQVGSSTAGADLVVVIRFEP